jgi:membrane protein implicated in regulation of membrane protease activity
VSEQGKPGPDKGPGQISWLIRGVVAAVALYFIADGLLGMWPDASTTARVVIVVAVLVVAFVVVGLVYLARRGRQD